MQAEQNLLFSSQGNEIFIHETPTELNVKILSQFSQAINESFIKAGGTKLQTEGNYDIWKMPKTNSCEEMLSHMAGKDIKKLYLFPASVSIGGVNLPTSVLQEIPKMPADVKMSNIPSSQSIMDKILSDSKSGPTYDNQFCKSNFQCQLQPIKREEKRLVFSTDEKEVLIFDYSEKTYSLLLSGSAAKYIPNFRQITGDYEKNTYPYGDGRPIKGFFLIKSKQEHMDALNKLTNGNFTHSSGSFSSMKPTNSPIMAANDLYKLISVPGSSRELKGNINTYNVWGPKDVVDKEIELHKDDYGYVENMRVTYQLFDAFYLFVTFNTTEM